MDSWNLPSFSFPCFVESVGCGSGRGEESSGGGILRLIRIRVRIYEVRTRKDKRGFDLISDALPSVGCGTASRMQSAMQIGYAKYHRRSLLELRGKPPPALP